MGARTCWLRLALVFLAAFPGIALSQSDPVKEERDCIYPTDKEYMGFHHALDPDRIFRIELPPYHFAIPWKYLHPRPAKFLDGCKIRTESLGIQFWIPDGEAPERDLFFNGDYNPAEPWRPQPSENEWVIKFVDISYYSVEPPTPENPDVLFKNNMRMFEKEASIKQDGDLKLLEFNDPSKTSKYWLQQDDKKSMYFWCGTSVVCQGVINLKDKHLAGRFLLKSPSVKFHATIASTLQKLIQQWEVANK